LVLLGSIALGFGPADPAPSLTRPKDASRNLICERLSAEEGRAQRPGHVADSRARGDFVERSVLLCRERLIRQGVRAPRDEAILSTLDARASELARAAQGAQPPGQATTWLVETNYPSAGVAAKISFAAKNALMDLGLQVSDRTPVLSASDIEVLTRMPPSQAYPAACRRYFDSDRLGPQHAILAVMTRDLRETVLHAGVCTQGRWTWLR
jgi:hypothetical protein